MPFFIDDLLTPAETAQIFRISPRSLARLNRTGVVPSVRIGRKTRYSASIISQLIGGSSDAI
jgi:hypothetical protein